MNAKDLIISIKTLFDKKGTDDANRQLDSLSSKATAAGSASNTAAHKAGTGWADFRKKVSATTESISAIKNLFVGFGAVGAITAVIGQFKAIKAAIDEAKQAQEDLKLGLAELKEAAAAQFSAKLIDAMTDSLKQANDEIARLRQLTEFKKNAQRTFEDATSDDAMARELAAISPDDPLAAAKKGEITAKYASASGVRGAQRKLEDVTDAIYNNETERASFSSNAATLEKASRLKENDAEFLRNKAETTISEGNTPVKAPWWKFWGTARPDPKAQLDAAQKAADTNSQADTAAKEAENLRTNAANAKAEAESRRARTVYYERERGAAVTGVETARLTGSISRREASESTEAARISYISGAMRTQVTDRLDSGITQLETSPTAQASPTAQKLLESAKAFRQKVDGMDMQSFLAATKEINAALDRFQVILLDAKRAAKQTTSQIARQRDAD